MKVPRRLSELLQRKQEFIDLNRSKLEASVIKLQEKLLNTVIAEVIPSLDVEDGRILDTTKNYQILGDLDKVYKEFSTISSATLSSQIISTTNGLVNLGKGYFGVALTQDLGSRFDKVVNATANKMNARIGVKGGQMVRGGFLDSVFKDQSLATQIKSFIAKSVTGQIDTKEFIKGLTTLIDGGDKKGALEKQYERYAYDVYQQYDAAYNATLAQEFDMNYFIYQGGLINDSRDFCVAHNNKVWSRDEAEDWTSWTPSLGEYPEGYEVKQKDIYAHPGYMDYPGYSPLVDRGGYNCRHMLGWISDSLAFDLREELKDLPVKSDNEPIKEPAPQKENEFVEAKTIKEAESYARNTLQIPNVNFKGLSNKDVSIANDMNKSVKYHLDKYPFLKDTLNFTGTTQGHYELEVLRVTERYKTILKNKPSFSALGTEQELENRAISLARRSVRRTPSNVYAVSYSGDLKGIGWNSKYKFDEAVKLLDNDVKAKFHPEGTNTIKSVMDHELGHRLDELLKLRSDSYINEVVKDSYKQGMDYTANNLSRYATRTKTPTAEFIAESWSEYLNNPVPREIATKIGKQIEKIYETQFIKTLEK